MKSSSGPLVVSRDRAVFIVRLSRPAKRNALDEASIEALREVFADLPADVGAAVLHGEGEHFCAGLDLEEMAGVEGMMQNIRHSRLWHRAFDEIQFGRVPVVAALHGAVIGGGLELASAAHIRVAERSAYYGLPEGQRGLSLGGGGSVRIPRLIGLARVQDMMLTGRTLSAEEGVAAGLSQYLVADGEGLAKATALAHRIADNAALSNYAIIHALPRSAEGDPASGYQIEALMAAIASASPEAKDRLHAFLEKRAGKVTRGS